MYSTNPHSWGTAKQCDFVLKKKHGSPDNALTALFWAETSQRFSHHLDEAPHGDERRWVCSRYQVHSKGIVTWNPKDLYFWRSFPPKTRPTLPIKTRGPIWVPGRYLIFFACLEIFVLQSWYLCQASYKSYPRATQTRLFGRAAPPPASGVSATGLGFSSSPVVGAGCSKVQKKTAARLTQMFNKQPRINREKNGSKKMIQRIAKRMPSK